MTEKVPSQLPSQQQVVINSNFLFHSTVIVFIYLLITIVYERLYDSVCYLYVATKNKLEKELFEWGEWSLKPVDNGPLGENLTLH